MSIRHMWLELLLVLSLIGGLFGVIARLLLGVLFVCGKSCRTGCLPRTNLLFGVFSVILFVCCVRRMMNLEIIYLVVALTSNICFSTSIILLQVSLGLLLLMMLWQWWVECVRGRRVNPWCMLCCGLRRCIIHGSNAIFVCLGN